METTKKTYKILMFPTYKSGVIWKFDATDKLIPVQGTMKSDLPFKKYHLYVMSDDDIKGGYLFHANRGVGKFVNNSDLEDTIYVDFDRGAEQVTLSKCKRIIASSDKEITPTAWIGKSYVDDYINANNAGNPINEIELEYEPNTQKLATGEEILGNEIKVIDDGSIVVEKPKLFTYNDVAHHIHSVLSDFSLHMVKTGGIPDGFDSDKWIKENIK